MEKNEKIELNMLCKAIKHERKNLRELKQQIIIEDTLEGTKNIKKMWKSLSLGKKWASYLLNEKGTKITDRELINELATRFYEQLYSDEGKVKL